LPRLRLTLDLVSVNYARAVGERARCVTIRNRARRLVSYLSHDLKIATPLCWLSFGARHDANARPIWRKSPVRSEWDQPITIWAANCPSPQVAENLRISWLLRKNAHEL